MIIDGPDAMLAAGRAFAAGLRAGDVATLSGGLGAGKTLFCKGVLQGLGFQGDVPSPTFNIINNYAPPDTKIPVIHADLYRLNAPEELEELGLLEFDERDGICLIEWPEQAGSVFADARYRIEIERIDDMRRTLTIQENG
jgi:tRNA threonylcarbamoyladenosine biosynthesis protein TsaE